VCARQRKRSAAGFSADFPREMLTPLRFFQRDHEIDACPAVCGARTWMNFEKICVSSTTQ
jgi:hypothetical protein